MGLVTREINGDNVKCIYKSSNILVSEYNMPEQLLEITFKNGIKYKYFKVSSSDHAGLQIAESTGKYFNQHIKKHSYEKVGKVPINEYLSKIQD